MFTSNEKSPKQNLITFQFDKQKEQKVHTISAGELNRKILGKVDFLLTKSFQNFDNDFEEHKKLKLIVDRYEGFSKIISQLEHEERYEKLYNDFLNFKSKNKILSHEDAVKKYEETIINVEDLEFFKTRRAAINLLYNTRKPLYEESREAQQLLDKTGAGGGYGMETIVVPENFKKEINYLLDTAIKISQVKDKTEPEQSSEKERKFSI